MTTPQPSAVPPEYDDTQAYVAGEVVRVGERLFAAGCDIPPGNPPQ